MKGGEDIVSFDSFVLGNEGPIYQQIIRYLQRGLAAGTICTGDELPSRRVLSARLGVNPNTVQKAYRLLEEAGLIASHAGAKSFISAGPEEIRAVRAQLLTEEARRLVDALRQTGVSRAEAMDLLGRLWDEETREGIGNAE